MPGFVRTKQDEERWKRAKDAAAKETDRGSEGFWKLSNYIFHKMGKSEESQRVADFFKSELLKNAPVTGGGFAFGIGKGEMKKFGGMGQLSLGEKVKSPMHAGTHSQSVKIPKQKHMPGPDAKPSVFFKGEDIEPKHPNLKGLKDFIISAMHRVAREVKS